MTPARAKRLICIALLCAIATVAEPVFAQTTVGTGSIVGTITDPSGAVVAGADVLIATMATGQQIKVSTNLSGSFNSGALLPGDYKIQISAKGFSSLEAHVSVLLGNTATLNVSLQVGQESEIVQVQGSEIRINTEQPTVQGVLTVQQVENLPVNGRNFLDLAQLEPGVQIQDGSNFGNGKEGFSSISFGGRFGRQFEEIFQGSERRPPGGTRSKIVEMDTHLWVANS
jgi:Carboxypeptidase regulatory-like domain